MTSELKDWVVEFGKDGEGTKVCRLVEVCSHLPDIASLPADRVVLFQMGLWSPMCLFLAEMEQVGGYFLIDYVEGVRTGAMLVFSRGPSMEEVDLERLDILVRDVYTETGRL